MKRKFKKDYRLLNYDNNIGQVFYLIECSDGAELKAAQLDKFGNIKFYLHKNEIPKPYYQSIKKASIDTKMRMNKQLKLYSKDVQYGTLMQSLPDGFFLKLLHKYKTENTPLDKRIAYLKKCYLL